MIPASELRDVDAADVYKGDLLAGSLTCVGNDVVSRYVSDYLGSASAPDLAGQECISSSPPEDWEYLSERLDEFDVTGFED
ncbi:hypothetical protein [Rhodococcus sp. KRD162]|uniref:hypothetical protein n=1 Tax=Rhodococcus sp. KRD162 TaxID=2729725 RepID=UPI0019D24E67